MAQRWIELRRNFKGGGAARVCGGGGFGSMGVQGSRGCCFYSPGLGLGVRATPERRALHPDSGRVRVLPEVGDDGRAPRDRGREGAGLDWARRRGTGRHEETGPREGKGKWAGLGWKREGEKEKPSHFLKRFKLFQFKFKPKDLNLN